MSGRWTVCALLLATVLVGCGSDVPDAQPLLQDGDQVEGLVDAPPARLDTLGVGEPRELPEGGCVTSVEVAPAGGTAGGPRWLVTYTLGATPTDEADLGRTLGADACAALVATEDARILAAFGAVSTDTVSVTYLDPDGRRWLPGTPLPTTTDP